MMRVILNGDGRTSLGYDIQYNITPELLQQPIIYEELKEVEDVYKIEGLAMYTHEWGVKSPQDLSNGTKALILFSCFDKHHVLVSSACCGANVAKFVGQLSNVCDFDMALDYFFDIPDDDEINAIDSETGVVLHNGREFIDYYAGKAGVPEEPLW